MAGTRDRIAQAQSALAQDEPRQAIAALMPWWRETRSGAVGEAIARIAARTPAPPVDDHQQWLKLADDPDAPPRRLQLGAGKLADIEARAQALAEAAPDSRIGDAAVALLAELPFTSDTAKPAWRAVLALLPVHGDERLAAAELPARWRVRDGMRKTLVHGLEQALAALAPKLRGATVSEAQRAALAALAPLVASAKAQPAGALDEAGLLAAIYADPAADAPRLVYADFLLERGEARGELIMLQCKSDRTSDDDKRIAALVKANAKKWVGPLADVLYTNTVELGRGFPVAATVKIHDGRDVERLGAHPAWATFERLDYPDPRSTNQARAQHHVGAAMRHVRALTGLGKEGVSNVVAAGVSFLRLESIDAKIPDEDIAAAFAQSAQLPALRRFTGRMGAEQLFGARWAGQLTHLSLISQLAGDDPLAPLMLLPVALTRFPRLEELSWVPYKIGAPAGPSISVTRGDDGLLSRIELSAGKDPAALVALLPEDAATVIVVRPYPNAKPNLPALRKVVPRQVRLKRLDLSGVGGAVEELKPKSTAKAIKAAPLQPLVVHSLAWTPDGKRLVLAAKRVAIVDAQTLAEERRVGALDARAREVAVSPDGTELLIAQHSAELWTVDGQRRFKLDKPDYAGTIGWSPDGKRLFATGTGDLRVYDRDGTAVAKWSASNSAAFTPDGAAIAWVQPVGARALFVRPIAGRRATELPGTDYVRTFAWTAGGLAIRGEDFVALWDAAGTRELRRLKTTETSPYGRTALSADGRVLALTGDKSVTLLATDGSSKHRVAARDPRALAFSPDGRRLALAHGGGVLLLDAASGAELGRYGRFDAEAE